MNVRIYIKNALTKEVITDNVIDVDNTSSEVMDGNHRALSEGFPDCHVNFEWPSIDVEKFGMNFIAGVPVNMELDQDRVANGEMDWKDYELKWFGLNWKEILAK